MPELSFQIEGATPVTFAAAPLLAFKLRVANTPAKELIHTIVLRCQIQIETTRRHYTPQEQEQLLDLFGTPDRWSQTLRSMLWTFTNTVVPRFSGSTVVDLSVPCTYDFNVAAAKYFYALQDGNVPLTLMFSGTVFYKANNGLLQVSQIPWTSEASYQLPIEIWQKMMDHYYPNSAWLSLRRDVFDQLYRYKMQRGLPTWEQVIETLLIKEQVTP